MVESDLPFGPSPAQRLMKVMKVSSDARLTNAAHGQHLPGSWRTIYEITKLSDDEFSPRSRMCLSERRIDELERRLAALEAKGATRDGQ